MYEIHKNSIGEMIRVANDDGSVTWIPIEPANRRYQEYLEWVEEGNTALVVEEDA
jgi:hypothetical protein